MKQAHVYKAGCLDQRAEAKEAGESSRGLNQGRRLSRRMLNC